MNKTTKPSGYKYIPFTADTFLGYRERWWSFTADNIRCKVVAYSNEGITVGTDIDLNFYTWLEFMEIFTDTYGNPAGIMVGNE